MPNRGQSLAFVEGPFAGMSNHRKTSRRIWRRLLVGGLVSGAVLVTLFRTPSPVGHWTSTEGHIAYVSTYREAMGALPTPSAIMDVRTDFGIVRVYRFVGSGPSSVPLVLLPGTASGSPVWADNIPSLLQIGDIYTIDLLGEPGMSVQERPITDAADQAQWLDQALAALPEDRFHLVGMSIGGWTAANLATLVPQRVASLTVIDPVFVFDSIPLWTIIRSIPASVSWLPSSWRDRFNSWTAGGAPVKDVPVARMIEAGMQHYAMRLPQPVRITEQALSEMPVPMLAIIAGASVMHDTVNANAVAERTADRVRHYPTASHAINGEYPTEIAADIAAFMQESD